MKDLHKEAVDYAIEAINGSKWTIPAGMIRVLLHEMVSEAYEDGYRAALEAALND